MLRPIFQDLISRNLYLEKIFPAVNRLLYQCCLPNGARARISLRIGIDWSQTFPVPRIVARNKPSPPKTIDFRFPDASISKSSRFKGNNTSGINAKRFVIQLSLYNSAACMDKSFAVAFEFLEDESFPPSSPDPILRLRVMDSFVPKAAQRNPSFCTIRVFLTCFRSTGIRAPG